MQQQLSNPVQNGGRTEQYIWKQTHDELSIFVFMNITNTQHATDNTNNNSNIQVSPIISHQVFSSMTKKDIKLIIQDHRLRIMMKNQIVLDKQLQYKINRQESIWIIQTGIIQGISGKYLQVRQKQANMENQGFNADGIQWWSTPFIGDSQIDISKIQYDTNIIKQQTNYTINQFSEPPHIRYVPTTQSQIQKQKKLAQFIRCHPELDFSKVKFN